MTGKAAAASAAGRVSQGIAYQGDSVIRSQTRIRVPLRSGRIRAAMACTSRGESASLVTIVASGRYVSQLIPNGCVQERRVSSFMIPPRAKMTSWQSSPCMVETASFSLKALSIARERTPIPLGSKMSRNSW